MIKPTVLIGVLLMAAAAWADSFTAPSITGFNQVNDTSQQSFNFQNPITKVTDSGNYEEWVFQSNTTGTLDFVYQFSVSQGAVEQMTGAVYDCSVVTGLTSFGSGGSPSGENCNSASQTADFQFGNTMGPGTMSQYLEVATSATSYGNGSIEFQDGANGYAQGFAPVTTAPEPGSLALVGIGLVGSFGVFRRKRPI